MTVAWAAIYVSNVTGFGIAILVGCELATNALFIQQCPPTILATNTRPSLPSPPSSISRTSSAEALSLTPLSMQQSFIVTILISQSTQISQTQGHRRPTSLVTPQPIPATSSPTARSCASCCTRPRQSTSPIGHHLPPCLTSHQTTLVHSQVRCIQISNQQASELTLPLSRQDWACPRSRIP